MAQVLDQLERDIRKEAAARARLLAVRRPLHSFIFSFIVAPFAFAGILFVPLFGIVLVVTLLLLTARYLWLLRSMRVTAAVAAGAFASSAATSAFLIHSIERSDLLLYILAAFSVAILLLSLVLVAGALWSHHERGAEAISGAAASTDR
jgi:hypothetical protein